MNNNRIVHRHYPIDRDERYTVVMDSHRFEFSRLGNAKRAIDDWYLTGAAPCEIYECDRDRGWTFVK